MGLYGFRYKDEDAKKSSNKELLDWLSSTNNALSSDEAEKRLQEYSLNELTEKKANTF